MQNSGLKLRIRRLHVDPDPANDLSIKADPDPQHCFQHREDGAYYGVQCAYFYYIPVHKYGAFSEHVFFYNIP